MYRKQVRRRRAVLALLVIVSFVLLTASFGQGSTGLQRAVGTVFGPFEEAVSRALKPARDLINWFDETFEARGENRRLREQLEQARADALAGQAARQENEQLRAMNQLRKSGAIPSGYETVTGRVIARSPSLWTSTVTIDKGSSAGVEVDDPVVNGDGLVGRIASVTTGNAQVQLITDPGIRVSGKVLPGGSQGIVQPEIGNPTGLVLGFLDQAEDISRGDRVVTAGWKAEGRASRYPPNLPIGEVTRAPLIDQEALRQVTLRPYVDVGSLDLLQVLTGGWR